VRYRVASTAGTLALALSLFGPGNTAQAASVVGTYDVVVGGLRVGIGGLRANVTKGSYTATATVKMAGIARLVADARGSATSSGAHLGSRVIPNRYSISTSSGKYVQSVRMAMAGGAVRMLAIEPEPRHRPDAVPVTMAERRGVVDPVGALVMPVPGTADVMSPASCARTLPVFDGRQRYDISLEFDRKESVQSTAPESYSGPVIVCRARYKAIAGHRPDTDNVKELEASRDIEVWLAPVPGARVLVPWKISAITPSGRVVISASKLLMSETAQRVDAADPAEAAGKTELAAKRTAAE
jgi:hypothetical protein